MLWWCIKFRSLKMTQVISCTLELWRLFGTLVVASTSMISSSRRHRRGTAASHCSVRIRAARLFVPTVPSVADWPVAPPGLVRCHGEFWKHITRRLTTTAVVWSTVCLRASSWREHLLSESVLTWPCSVLGAPELCWGVMGSHAFLQSPPLLPMSTCSRKPFEPMPQQRHVISLRRSKNTER